MLIIGNTKIFFLLKTSACIYFFTLHQNKMEIKYIYHLTKNGWVKGFYKNELGQIIEIPNLPTDRVLTARYVEDLTPLLGGIGWETISNTQDIDLLEKLYEKYPLDILPFPEDK
jgi:hypothetical protein